MKSNLCTVEQLPAQVKLRFSRVKLDDAASRKRKGKGKEGEDELRVGQLNEASQQNRLATLDIFAGCGGLSEGLQRSGNYRRSCSWVVLNGCSSNFWSESFILSGVSDTKWAIEYEEPAGDAFKLNHPEAKVFIQNCNVILRYIIFTLSFVNIII